METLRFSKCSFIFYIICFVADHHVTTYYLYDLRHVIITCFSIETLYIYGSVCMLESKNSFQNQACSMSVFGACNSWTAWNRSDSSSCLPQSFLTTKRSGQVIVGVLFLHAYAANGLSHGCSFWVIAAWCLSPCVRSFDRGSYYTFFDQLGMDFLFSVYVFWVCVSHVALTM